MTVLIAYQTALNNILTADLNNATGNTLKTLGATGLFDYYPTGQALPYLAFGESSETSTDPIGATTGSRMSDVVMTIEVVTNAPGSQQSLNILDRIEVLLDTNLTLSRGVASGRPDFTIDKAVQDQVTGLWKFPVEVHQLITNI